MNVFDRQLDRNSTLSLIKALACIGVVFIHVPVSIVLSKFVGRYILPIATVICTVVFAAMIVKFDKKRIIS